MEHAIAVRKPRTRIPTLLCARVPGASTNHDSTLLCITLATK